MNRLTALMKVIYILSVTRLLSACSKIDNLIVKSLDGKIRLTVTADGGILSYSVDKENSGVILSSKLGFILEKGDSLNRFVVKGTERSTIDVTWEQPWGESRYVWNNYNELKVLLQETEGTRKLNVVFHLFNDEIGYRYEFPEQTSMDSLIIRSEETEFKMPRVHKAWWIPTSDLYYESITQYSDINKMDTTCTLLTMERWNVGCITDENARKLNIPLNFLDAADTYLAQIYTGDDEQIGKATLLPSNMKKRH